MPKFDVWLYCLTVDAESDEAALLKVNNALDDALATCTNATTQEILESINVDYCEEIDI